MYSDSLSQPLEPDAHTTLVDSMANLSLDMGAFVQPLSPTPLPQDVRSPLSKVARSPIY